MKLLLFSGIFSAVLTISYAAHAQDWWQRAKDVLNTKPETQVIQPEQSNGFTSGNIAGLTNSEIGSGLREALKIGTEKVVNTLGSTDGFNLDPNIHIPLPKTLSRVDSALSTIGMSSLTDDLELRLNRAAEAATPKAKELFITAISEMTIEDAKNILTGPENAATQYLRQKMGPGLGKEMQPIVQNTLASTGAIKAYDNIMGEYSQIPFVPDVKANLNEYVVEKAMDGIFYYVGKEEAAIRTNPAARTTDLLKKVFSSR